MRVKTTGEYDRIIIRKQDRIDYILDGVSEYFDIPRQELIKRYRNPTKYNRKRIAIKLLIDVADCKIADIKDVMGATSDTAISYTLCGIREDLSSSCNNLDLKKEYKDVFKFLKL